MPTADRLTIRPVELADLPALESLIADARREYGVARRDAKLLDDSAAELHARYQRQRTLYFVALLDGEVVGGAGIAPHSPADPLTCELQGLYLRADARGRGIGDALLERCLAAARQFLYVRCYLETLTQMQAALEFYGRHGFRDLDVTPPGESAARPDRWMIRNLRASARAAGGTGAVRAPDPARAYGASALGAAC